MRQHLLAALFLCTLTTGSAEGQSQTPAGLGPFDSPVMREYFVDLLHLSGEGYRNTERSAFIVLERTGEVRCLLWPFHNGFQSEQFHGQIPVGTIAIAHTHPRNLPKPSFTDRSAAMRLGLPFVIVTPRHLYTVEASGQILPLIRNQPWAKGISRESQTRCENLPG